MTVDTVDPFALPEESRVAQRSSDLSGGRYRFPRRDGTHKPYGWQRVTNLVGAYADQFALQRWEQEQICRGLQARPDLFQEILTVDFEVMSKTTRREWVGKFVERCKDASGANLGRDHGNHRHAVVELMHAGKPVHSIGRRARVEVELYKNALERGNLRALEGMQERRVLVEELEAVGTLDNILEDMVTNLLHVGDLKTQKRFWTALELAAQFGCYAHAVAMWDPVAGKWVDMPPVSKEIGLVLWMPRVTEDGQPRVDVYEVDTVKGYETAKLAYKIVKDRSAAKTVKNPRMWLRPARPMTETERYAALFAGVETMQEGRKLTEEARSKGLWSPELAGAANAALDRIGIVR